MTLARGWRSRTLDGPYPVLDEDITPLNAVFSESFTERYRRDGMVGVRVPNLNPLIWRYAIADAEGGAMLWRDDRGEIAAFNIAHASGREGWMGPLAVRPDLQGAGQGKTVVRAGIEWLQRMEAHTIGLETMPRTMDNIGFYSGLGFVPGRLTLTVTLDGAAADRVPVLLSRLSLAEQDDAITECAALSRRLLPATEFTREIRLTAELALGDTVLLRDGGRIVGFAVCHAAPLVEGRSREELRVLKLVLEEPAHLDRFAGALADLARRSGTRRVAIRVQGDYPWMYSRLVALGARVRWTDLRMTLDGYPEPTAARGAVLSNWEI